MARTFLSSARIQIARRRRQLANIWLEEGREGLNEWFRTAAATWLRPRRIAWPVLPQDALVADLSRPRPESRIRSRGPISINWVTTPSGPGSGGHTTCYRIIKYLDKAGYDNRVFFYHVHRADQKYFEGVAREYYGLTCPIEDIRSGMPDADAVVATSWPTAYVAFNAACSGKRFYFVQDFEPHFYPVGTYSVMAENTYRMGFHGITAGAWLAQKLTREYGMDADYFPFGSDTSRYHRDPTSRRSGVAFYVRSGTPRRGSELGLLALELFAKRRPHAQIHLFGDKLEGLSFNCINHGPVSPAKLNDIYNQCFAGLCLSFTNVSLVPHEMLAAGCVPVVNDADHNRIVLDNPYVRYAPSTPHALASALEETIDIADFNALSRLASESVKSMTWDDAAAAVDAAFKRALNASRPAGMLSGPNRSASSVGVARLSAHDR